MNLYELTKEFRQLAFEIEEAASSDDVDAIFSISEDIQLLQMPFEEKLEGYVRWLKNVEAEEQALEDEIARLKKRKDSLARQQEAIKRAMKDALHAAQERKVKLPIATVSLRKPCQRIEIDMDEVPNWPVEIYDAGIARVVETTTVNKNELKKLDGFENLPGVTIIDGEEGIQIR